MQRQKTKQEDSCNNTHAQQVKRRGHTSLQLMPEGSTHSMIRFLPPQLTREKNGNLKQQQKSKMKRELQRQYVQVHPEKKPKNKNNKIENWCT